MDKLNEPKEETRKAKYRQKTAKGTKIHSRQARECSKGGRKGKGKQREVPKRRRNSNSARRKLASDETELERLTDTGDEPTPSEEQDLEEQEKNDEDDEDEDYGAEERVTSTGNTPIASLSGSSRKPLRRGQIKSTTESRRTSGDAWTWKGKLKNPDVYLMRLPISKNVDDYITSKEKPLYMNGTSRSRRPQEFNTLCTKRRTVRKRKRAASVQSR